MKIIKGAKVRLYLTNHQIKVACFYKRMKVYLTNLIYRYLLGRYRCQNKPSKKETCDFIRRLMKMRRFRILVKIQQNLIFLVVLNAYDQFYHSIDYANEPPIFLDNRQNKITIPVPVDHNSNTFLKDIDHIWVPLDGIGKAKVKGFKMLELNILRCTLVIQYGKQYYLSFAYEAENRKTKPLALHKRIGIDAGIHDLLTFSNGRKIRNPKFSLKYKSKISTLQRLLLKKEKGSNNYQKIKRKIAVLYQRIHNKRIDFLHQITKRIVRNYDYIFVEALDIRSLRKTGKNHPFGKGCMRSYDDACLSEFYRQLEYKAVVYQKRLVKVSTYYPSSQVCNRCGYKNPLLKNPRIKKWECPKCKSKHDRDINAAINIMNFGLKSINK